MDSQSSVQWLELKISEVKMKFNKGCAFQIKNKKSINNNVNNVIVSD